MDLIIPSTFITMYVVFWATYKLFLLNEGNNLNFQSLFLLIIFLLFIVNRFIFIYDFYFDDSPGFFNLGNANIIEKNNYARFFTYLIPTVFFPYLALILGLKYSRSFLLGIPFIILSILEISDINNFIFYKNLRILGLLYLIISSTFSIVIIFHLIMRESSDLLTSWVFGCIFAYNLASLKLISGYLYPEEFSQMNEINYMLTANLVVMFLIIPTVTKGKRILTGDLRYDSIINFKKFDVNKNTIILSLHSKYRIWNLREDIFLDESDLLSSNDVDIIINNKSKFLKEIMQAEIDFLQNKRDFKYLQNPFYFSELLGINYNTVLTIFNSVCRYSFSDYTKLLRVLKADILIREGFLKTSDVDSLAKICFFNNRITLYNNFKKFLGKSISTHKKSIKSEKPS